MVARVSAEVGQGLDLEAFLILDARAMKMSSESHWRPGAFPFLSFRMYDMMALGANAMRC